MYYLQTSISQPVEYISGGRFITESTWSHSRRVIDSFEIIIGINDILYIEQEGIQYEVGAGDILLILPNKRHHGYRECNKNLSFYWFHFSCPHPVTIFNDETINKEMMSLKVQPDLSNSKSEIYIPFNTVAPSIERINILSQQLLHVDNDNYYTRMSMHYLMTLLLIEISEQTLTHLYFNKKTQDNILITQIMEWARINIVNGITIGDIAEKFNYNKDYLSRFFKRKTGYSLQEHLHLLKLSKAKDLLLGTSMSVKEVSFKVGINDEKYFMRLFKKYEKMTASEYRKAFCQTHFNNN